MPPPTVYISHSFQDKHQIAVPLQEKLLSSGISTVLGNDETVSLNNALENTHRLIQTVPVAVFFVTPDFKEGTWPGMEVQWFLHRKKQAHTGTCCPVLVPVFCKSSSYEPEEPTTLFGNCLTLGPWLSHFFGDRHSRDGISRSLRQSLPHTPAPEVEVAPSVRELLELSYHTSVIYEENDNFLSGGPYIRHFRRTELIDRIVEQVCKSHRLISTVFISHAGDDKDNVAVPICDELSAMGITCFIDKKDLRPGHVAKRELEEAMKAADIGVFIVSPEFAGRKWTFNCFLKRHREAEEAGIRVPDIIPVFYRLTVEDCSDSNLYSYTSETGRVIFDQGFFEPERQVEIPTKMAISCLQDLTAFCGIRNEEGAMNDLECQLTRGVTELHDKSNASPTPH